MDQELNRVAREVIETALSLSRLGLNVNKSGNVSARVALNGVDGFVITPTGVAYEKLVPEDLPWLPLRADVTEKDAVGAARPSSEWLMHAATYLQRPEMGAVVHTHSTYATALACQNLPIPPFHYMVAVSGGMQIEVVPYETFGSSALAYRAAAGLEKMNACLLEHHGVLVVGKNLERALSLANEVENLARQYVVVRSLGEPRLIDAEEMQKVIAQFTTYGQPQKRVN